MGRSFFVKKAIAAWAVLAVVGLAGCGGASSYQKLSMAEAQKQIEAGTDYLIVDVRSKKEYDEGHIPGALLVPIEDIKEDKLDALPDKNRKIMVYCWTGRRSEDAAMLLEEDGYTSICDIGGFVDWKGKIEK